MSTHIAHCTHMPRHELRKHRQCLGKTGETLAKQHFLKLGYTVCAENWWTRFGEIDLVVAQGDTCVAVEVKTRTSEHLGSGFEAITEVKLRRLRSLFAMWLSEQCHSYHNILSLIHI